MGLEIDKGLLEKDPLSVRVAIWFNIILFIVAIVYNLLYLRELLKLTIIPLLVALSLIAILPIFVAIFIKSDSKFNRLYSKNGNIYLSRKDMETKLEGILNVKKNIKENLVRSTSINNLEVVDKGIIVGLDFNISKIDYEKFKLIEELLVLDIKTEFEKVTEIPIMTLTLDISLEDVIRINY